VLNGEFAEGDTVVVDGGRDELSFTKGEPAERKAVGA
jgi:hypothetical protein